MQNRRPFNSAPQRPFKSSRRPNFKSQNSENRSPPQKVVWGLRAVSDLLQNNPGLIHRIVFQKGAGRVELYELQKVAKRLHIHHQQLEAQVLEQHASNHGGVIAYCHETEIWSWDQVWPDLSAQVRQQSGSVVVVVGNVEDPRNLGACLRSALALGAQVVLMPAKGMCGLTPAVARSSAGALNELRICRPDNLEQALGELAEAGYNLVGLDGEGEQALHQVDFAGHSVIIVGGEDRGLPPYMRKQCHAVARIPMGEKAHSYNASVALSLALYECARQREFANLRVL